MPRFDYECIECNEIYKDVIRSKEDLEEEAAHGKSSVFCCDMPMQRLFSVPAIHFKGKGFYSTDK